MRNGLLSPQNGAGADMGRTLWGVLGLGAFGFQLQEVPDGRHIVTTTRSHSNKLVTDTVDAMEPDDVIRVGGAGNKVNGLEVGNDGVPAWYQFSKVLSLSLVPSLSVCRLFSLWRERPQPMSSPV